MVLRGRIESFWTKTADNHALLSPYQVMPAEMRYRREAVEITAGELCVCTQTCRRDSYFFILLCLLRNTNRSEQRIPIVIMPHVNGLLPGLARAWLKLLKIIASKKRSKIIHSSFARWKYTLKIVCSIEAIFPGCYPSPSPGIHPPGKNHCFVVLLLTQRRGWHTFLCFVAKEAWLQISDHYREYDLTDSFIQCSLSLVGLPPAGELLLYDLSPLSFFLILPLLQEWVLAKVKKVQKTLQGTKKSKSSWTQIKEPPTV